MRNALKFTSVLATAGIALSLAACGSNGDSSSSDANAPLTVVASPTPHGQILKYVKDNLADKAGLKLNVKEVTDYVTPNTAVQDGSADANYFQHVPYLEDFNKKRGTDIVSVEAVHLEPLGVYSKKVKAIAELPDGATIGLPNDATNEGRALKLLADNKLITLKDGAGTAATPADVTGNPKNFKWKELEAAQLPRSIADLDAAVINGNYALDSGLKPATDAIVLEKAEGNPYANILAVKKGKENDPRVKKLAELLHSAEVKKFIDDTFQGSVIPAF
ncbi:MetQ/NlpA family ABC transporter substrate-binding protein [Kitasatospora purpeofusca]|uniref:MetQ/NlpA family ABC transporter substrate-binding protein n=1 Tax=Kitasatospora purpeofusca TaxID=67352 RepID=UPI0022543772|nr:MetQ/NlpA family ABC transporter substrate-binding protein [Kitasatospora purpeofusca]MCX4758143.1 MetQ/NlpA family ABC transporter substrate-binding protein [Kitasatospora purpeofusca]WSR31388.1 MetQ/NlpA family ABC transporter substrate-binding protein [Kitasatospora purpeofusca]WSR39411.1 MetQ/NlpA family ABC transporter substrate-binding protein [Kitasatospora purpeofusca]